MIHFLTPLAFGLHIGGGSVALVSGTLALFSRKGGALHRRAGAVFFVSMLVMGSLAAYLAVVIPGQIGNLIGGAFVIYLVASGWMTVRRRGAVGLPEWIGLVFALCLCAPLVFLNVQRGLGLPAFSKSAVPVEGPVLVAFYVATAVVVIAAIGDARVVLAGGISGAPRIARHLWRMCLGLTIATGSAFTNGAARFLPGPYHVPAVFFLPQFVPVVLLVFWIIRIRLTPWLERDAVLQPA